MERVQQEGTAGLPSAGAYLLATDPRLPIARSIRGPHMRTIIAFTITPMSVDTNVSALKMSVAPIVASRTPSQYIMQCLQVVFAVRKGSRLVKTDRFPQPI